jgi:aminomethyltransferase
MSLKQTPLYKMHQKYGGKIIDFGGWALPVQFTGIIKEHHMVRQKAGLFDVSHMGEISITGPEALEFTRYLVTNDVKQLQDNQIIYTPMCYPDGGIVDDLLVYKISSENILLVVNAANLDKDFAWIKEHAFSGVEVENLSDSYAQLAVQGPEAERILQKRSDTDLGSIKFFWFKPNVKIAGVQCLVSRTGYTGEDGFEIYVSPDKAAYLWEKILETGGEDITPIGLGARDTLRFEAKLPLYGQEMDKNITPLEAGLGYFVKLQDDDFIGKEALAKQKQANPERVLVEFEMVDKGIPRSHYQVEKDGINIGWVTTGAHAPTLKKAIGLALIKQQYNQPGEEIDIIIRNKAVKARIARGIFYSKNTKSK